MRRSVLVMLIVVIICLFSVLFTEQVRSQTSLIDVTPEKLTFVGEENRIFSFLGNGKINFRKTLIIQETLGNEVSDVTLMSTDWYDLNSSNFISAQNVHFSPSSFAIPPRGLQEVIVTLEAINPRPGIYKGFIFISINDNSTLKVESTLILRENVLNKYLASIVIVSTIIPAFWILLRKKGDEKRHLISSLILLALGLLLIVILAPFKPELNVILVPTLFSPLIAYIINKLKSERDFRKKFDEASHEYRNKLVANESKLIGSLIRELSTHYAVFRATDWPEPSCLSTKIWQESKEVGLIANTHSGYLAKYYHYVPTYNDCIKTIACCMRVENTKNITEKRAIEVYSKNLERVKIMLAEVKKYYFAVEDLLYHLLIYDLGLLQQKYIARPVVHFPSKMTVTLKRWLKDLEVIRQGEEIDQNIYSEKKAEDFNKRMKGRFNEEYESLQQSLKELLKAIKEFKKSH